MKNKIIEKFVKKDKDLVVDLDEVEYLINDESLETIGKGENNIPLIQLFDGRTYFIDVKVLEKSLPEKGAKDYIDKKAK